MRGKALWDEEKGEGRRWQGRGEGGKFATHLWRNGGRDGEGEERKTSVETFSDITSACLLTIRQLDATTEVVDNANLI